MSLIRPELKSFLWRWREGLGAGFVVLLGLWFLWRGTTHFNLVLQLIGIVLLVLGGAILWAAYLRTRFKVDSKGLGLVEVTERQITYFAIDEGAAIALEAMTQLELRHRIGQGRVWVLKQSEGPSLHIPTAAEGAERLFDAFAALPGMDAARLVSALNKPSDQRVVIWRGPSRLHLLT